MTWRGAFLASASLAIADYVGRLSERLQPDCALALPLLTMKVQWNHADLMHVTPVLAKPPGRTTRRHSQDYRALAHYLDQPRWDILL